MAKYTYDELKHMNVKDLRDIAAGLNDESVQGYTQMNKDHVSIAFLDHRPLFPGHCLLIPRDHVHTLADLDDTLLNQIFLNSRLLARSVEQAMEAEGTFVINNKVSQSVPHLHIHVVPRNQGDGLRGFFWPRNPYDDDDHMEQVRERLQRTIEELN